MVNLLFQHSYHYKSGHSYLPEKKDVFMPVILMNLQEDMSVCLEGREGKELRKRRGCQDDRSPLCAGFMAHA